MIGHSPGIDPNKNFSDSEQDHPDVYHLQSYNLLPNIETNVFIAVTKEKDPKYMKDPLTTINEPFHFIVSQDRDVYDSDSFSDHQHEIHFLPNEFLKQSTFSEANIEPLRCIQDSDDTSWYCLGCSYKTQNIYTLSHMDTFIQYNNSKYNEYVYCDNCIQKLATFVLEELFVENYQEKIAFLLS